MSSGSEWKSLDTAAVIQKSKTQTENITSANVGSISVPIGPPLKRQVPEVVQKKKTKR